MIYVGRCTWSLHFFGGRDGGVSYLLNFYRLGWAACFFLVPFLRFAPMHKLRHTFHAFFWPLLRVYFSIMVFRTSSKHVLLFITYGRIFNNILWKVRRYLCVRWLTYVSLTKISKGMSRVRGFKSFWNRPRFTPRHSKTQNLDIMFFISNWRTLRCQKFVKKKKMQMQLRSFAVEIKWSIHIVF